MPHKKVVSNPHLEPGLPRKRSDIDDVLEPIQKRLPQNEFRIKTLDSQIRLLKKSRPPSDKRQSPTLEGFIKQLTEKRARYSSSNKVPD